MTLTRFAVAGSALAVVLFIHAPQASAQPCSFTISGASAVPASGGTARILVTAPPGTCVWNVYPTSGSGTLGRIFAPAAGDGYFEVTFGPNTTPSLRMAWVLVSGDGGFSSNLAATQLPLAGCSYSATGPSNAVSSSGGIVSVQVTSWNEFMPWQPCYWTPGAGAPWLIVPRGTRSGNGWVDITALPNPTAYSRTGTVYVAGDRTVTVTQLGQRPVRNVELHASAGADPILYDSASGRYDVFSLGVNGSESIRQRIDWYTWGSGKSIEPGDFDRDGLTDFVVYDSSSGECRMDLATHQTIVPARTLAAWDCGTGPLGAEPTILDANGDGLSDVFLYSPASGAWTLKLTNDITGGGVIYSDVSSGVWARGWQLSVARLDADSRDDLFAYNPNGADPNGGRWFKVFSRDNGTFEYVEGEMRWATGWTIVPGNFDADDETELFLYGGGGTGYWFIVDFRSAGTAYFGGQLWAAGWEIHPADFDGDGLTDLFLYQNAAGPLGGMWFRVLSTGSYDFDYIQGEMRWATGWRVSIGDLDGDGLSDVFLDGRSDGIAAQVLTRNAGQATEYAYDMAWPVADTILLPRRITP